MFCTVLCFQDQWKPLGNTIVNAAKAVSEIDPADADAMYKKEEAAALLRLQANAGWRKVAAAVLMKLSLSSSMILPVANAAGSSAQAGGAAWRAAYVPKSMDWSVKQERW